MDWLRLYVEVLDDEKVAKMSDRTYRIFTYLMLVARERDQSGVIDLPIKDIAWRLRMPSSHVHKAILDLESLNILSCNDGVLEFINWTKRQYKSDNVTERVQRFRKRRSNVSGNVIEQNRTETEQNKKPDGPFELPSKEEITESSEIKVKEDIEKVTAQLYDEKIFPKVHAFKNLALKNKKNLRSILHTLSRCYIAKPDEPWGYCLKTIGLEHMNYNERDYQKTAR